MDYTKNERILSHQVNKTINLGRLLNTISIILFMLVIFGGVTVLAQFRKPLLITGACFCGLSFIAANTKFRALNAVSLLWLISIAYMFIGATLSNYSQDAIPYVLVYICCFVAMISGFTKEDYILFIKIAEVVSIFLAFTILLEIIIQPLFTKYFSFIFPAETRARRIEMILAELSRGYYSGLLGEIGEAAFAMNILVAIELCKMFSRKKADKFSIVFLIIGIVSLMLTGKRTLFVIPFFTTILFVLVNKIKGKYIKILFAGCIVLLLFYIFIMIIPQAGIIFDRLFDSKGDALSGRDVLWNACKSINTHNPLFGTGLGTFTNYANKMTDIQVLAAQQGFDIWTTQAHSIYYQFYGELGVFGTVLVIGTIGYSFIKTIMLKSKTDVMDSAQKIIYHFSLYFQAWFLIYGLTGNVGHYTQDLIIYFMSIGMYLYLKYTLYPVKSIFDREQEQQRSNL